MYWPRKNHQVNSSAPRTVCYGDPRPMSWGMDIMAKYKAVHFNCPSCNTLYHVVKTGAGPVVIDSWVTCRTCHAPIPACEGKFRLKYFVLRQARARIHARVRAPNE
jgi:hypothetical protein